MHKEISIVPDNSLSQQTLSGKMMTIGDDDEEERKKEGGSEKEEAFPNNSIPLNRVACTVLGSSLSKTQTTSRSVLPPPHPH